MTLHKCKATLAKKAIIWKVAKDWRYLSDDKNIKHEHSNGDIITVCPFCRKTLE